MSTDEVKVVALACALMMALLATMVVVADG